MRLLKYDLQEIWFHTRNFLLSNWYLYCIFSALRIVYEVFDLFSLYHHTSGKILLQQKITVAKQFTEMARVEHHAPLHNYWQRYNALKLWFVDELYLWVNLVSYVLLQSQVNIVIGKRYEALIHLVSSPFWETVFPMSSPIMSSNQCASALYVIFAEQIKTGSCKHLRAQTVNCFSIIAVNASSHPSRCSL